jgi:lipopolysaccharide export system protein LptA
MLLPLAMLACLVPGSARAQGLDLSQGGPIAVTARDGIEWRQVEQQVIARGNARAQRDNVTVTADRLIAWYRKKPSASDTAPATPAHGAPAVPAHGAPAVPAHGAPADADSGGNEVYRLQAEGNVRIFTDSEQAIGDRATYDVDQAVLVMTGRDLRLITQNEVLTARDTLEYWSQKRMAVARGNAVVLTSDARRIAADTLVAYTGDSPTPGPERPPAARPSEARPAEASDPRTGKLEKVEAYGNVSIRTPTDMATGDRAVYVPDLGIARLGGAVRITRGQNQLNGGQAVVNMKTGVARLIGGGSERVQGLVLPNDPTGRSLADESKPPTDGGPASGQAR